MNPHRKHVIWLPVLLTIADRIITIPNWQHEANPLVTQLGPSLWIAVTLVTLVSMIGVWYRYELYNFRPARIIIGAYTVFVSLVLAVNVYMLTVVA